jgi:hypothetical protein
MAFGVNLVKAFFSDKYKENVKLKTIDELSLDLLRDILTVEIKELKERSYKYKGQPMAINIAGQIKYAKRILSLIEAK